MSPFSGLRTSKERSLTPSFYSRTAKRWFDAACASVGLVLLFPLFLVVAVAIKLTSRGPVFFRQIRIGRNELPFRIFKFRTMIEDAADRGPSLTAAGDTRVTTIGRWLRKSKADELPQLLNVLRGDMSLVGPRPEVPTYTVLYSELQKGVFKVRPGITGPAANNFVHEDKLLGAQQDQEAFYISTILPAKLIIDLSYSHDIRFSEDLKIIFTTVSKLVGTTASLPKLFFATPQKQKFTSVSKPE